MFAGGPPAYTTSQGQLQLAGVDSVYTGGRRRANLNAARYHVDAAGAGYRMAEKDVDLAVRLRFIEVLRADEEITIRQQGIARLRTYLTEVQNRKAAGQPVGSDVLTTQVRLGTEEAVLADAEQTRDEARLQLNDLLGRDPDGPLVLEPLPAPAPPTAPGGEPWLNAPEVRAAAANRGAAESGIAATRAERRPQLALSANLGVLPVFADSDAGTGINSGSGFGGMVMLSMSWPFWDGGAWRARLDRAQILATQARDSEAVVRRQSRLAWELANAQLTRLYQQVQSWAHNVPLARDAYLQTESIYNGGAATALEVLDAYAAWITVNDSYADAVLRYRQAEASYLRWGTP
jgi:outer membrane protein TolC